MEEISTMDVEDHRIKVQIIHSAVDVIHVQRTLRVYHVLSSSTSGVKKIRKRYITMLHFMCQIFTT
jgi:hypothetical protein